MAQTRLRGHLRLPHANEALAPREAQSQFLTTLMEMTLVSWIVCASPSAAPAISQCLWVADDGKGSPLPSRPPLKIIRQKQRGWIGRRQRDREPSDPVGCANSV